MTTRDSQSRCVRTPHSSLAARRRGAAPNPVRSAVSSRMAQVTQAGSPRGEPRDATRVHCPDLQTPGIGNASCVQLTVPEPNQEAR
jgi:hypothetical protein